MHEADGLIVVVFSLTNWLEVSELLIQLVGGGQ